MHELLRHTTFSAGRFLLCCPAALLVLSFSGTSALADEDLTRIPIDHFPTICTGYNPQSKRWEGVGSSLSMRNAECPPNSAIVSAMPALKRSAGSGAALVAIRANCCPLPAKDILTEEISYSMDICPDDYIAVGAGLSQRVAECAPDYIYPQGKRSAKRIEECRNKIHKIPSLLHCRKIYLKRYQLGEITTGLRKAPSSHLGYLFTERFTRMKEIPVALRYGVARASRTEYLHFFCLGYPWGSLFVGKKEKYCASILFRQLQFRGLPGDPAEGTPVTMFPDCLRLDNPLAVDPKCITAETSEEGTK